jgi:hypothetical protein
MTRDHNPWSGRRRPSVSIVGGSSDDHRDIEEKFCPRCNILLLWRDDLTSWFCKRCGYNPPVEDSLSISDDYTTTTTSTNDKPRLKNSKNADNDNNNNSSSPPIMPVDKSRSEEQVEDLHRRRFKYYDDDMRRLEEKGYTIIDAVEDIPTAGDVDTLSSDQLRRERERRTKGRW